MLGRGELGFQGRALLPRVVRVVLEQISFDGVQHVQHGEGDAQRVEHDEAVCGVGVRRVLGRTAHDVEVGDQPVTSVGECLAIDHGEDGVGSRGEDEKLACTHKGSSGNVQVKTVGGGGVKNEQVLRR